MEVAGWIRGGEEQGDCSVGILAIQLGRGDKGMRAWTRVLRIRKGRKERKCTVCLEEGLASCRPGPHPVHCLFF